MSNTEALRKALEFIQRHCANVIRTNSRDRDDWAEDMAYVGKVAADALAQQPVASGEPVAWFCEWFNADGSPEWDQYHDRTDPMPADDEWEDRPPDRVTPLYAAPQPAPARVPLTDEQIQAAWDSVDMRHPRGDATRNAFARAIEAAHGITSAKEAP